MKMSQQTMSMLKILALGNRQIEDGKVQTVSDVMARLRKQRTESARPASLLQRRLLEAE